MDRSQEKIINLSKTKLIFLLVGSLAFVALGAWIFTADNQNTELLPKLASMTLAQGIGLFTILFFGVCTLFAIKKLFDNKPGLVINPEGIIDNSSGSSLGFIPWDDVIGVDQYQIERQKFVSILVSDPHKYAERGNSLQRMAHRANINLCGTPIVISANSLQVNHEQLLKLIGNHYEAIVTTD